MIEFRRHILDNGLKIIVHEDKSTPLAAVSLLYLVGSRDENPQLTGLAHLFEHLMFRGSENIPDFDDQLQAAGGENNAFTNSDITNFYLTIPAVNLETAFWLEADRMKKLNLTEDSLENQKMVVLEEYRQSYINQPYGDATLLLRPLAFKVHPYRWHTIGEELHIKKVTLKDAKDFFYSHYGPDNCIMVVAGNVKTDEILRKAEKWFGKIRMRNIQSKQLPPEPPQQEERKLTVTKNVPADAIFKAWHICGRNETDFRNLDLLTDILAGGESGRLYTTLVRDKKMFSYINAYLTGDMDPGLLIIQGRLMNGVNYDVAEREIDNILKEIQEKMIEDNEMQKVKNKFETDFVTGMVNILNKAVNLSQYEMMGDAGFINREIENYLGVTAEMIIKSALKYLKNNNCSTLYYKSLNSN